MYFYGYKSVRYDQARILLYMPMQFILVYTFINDTYSARPYYFIVYYVTLVNLHILWFLRMANQSKPEQARANQSKPDHNKTDQTRPLLFDTISSQTTTMWYFKPDQSKPEQTRPQLSNMNS